MTDVTRDDWATLLEQLDEPPVGTVAEALADARDLDVGPAYDAVEDALEHGPLTELDAGGAFPTVRLEDDRGADAGEEDVSSDADVDVDPDAVDAREPRANSWADVDFSETVAGEYPPELLSVEQWMGRLEGDKKPFAPWGDRDPPVACSTAECPAAHADDEACECDGRFKWSHEGHYVDGDTVALAEDDPRLGGRVFIQREADPYSFVDGDDVRDPETGELHPAFVALLEHLGVTYADVSTSGTGGHAYYRGELPRGLPEAKWKLDDEPWGSNDDLPAVEIYSNTHVNVTTGDHVVGTGTEVREWDADALEAVLDANDQLPTETPSTSRDDVDLEGYEPTATESHETTDDIRDVFRALDRLDPKRVGDRTIVREWTNGRRSFLPTWGSHDDNGTANYINDEIWHDTGDDGGYGGPAVMAAIDAGLINHKNATPEDVSGRTFFEAIDHLRGLGFSIPELERGSTDPDAEAVAPLPFGHLDALSPADRKRAVRKRGVEIPSTTDARQRLRDAVFRELRAGNTTVLDAPTALGKSYGVATEPWRMRDSTTGGAPVVHLHETTDARDDTAADTRDSAATGAVLRGRKEASPLARGDHDPTPDGESDPDIVVTIDGKPASEWFDHQCDDKGLPFSTALALARERNDQGLDELPPVGQEDPAVAQWDGLPRDDDGEPAVDVIHATHQFAYVPSLRSHTNVILDEQPDYTVDLCQERIRRMVNAFLREIDAPVSTFGALTTLARSHGGGDAGREADAVDELLSHDADHGLGTEWFFSDPDAHALAPDLTRAIWKALRYDDADANGRVSEKVWHEPPRFDADEESYNAGTWLSVVVDEQNTIRQVRSTPDFSQARAVIGLDAHPSMSHWQLNGAPGMVRDAVLDPTERRLWRRYERGLTTVQVGDATRPRSGPKAREWMNDDRVRAVIEALRERHGSGFKTALSTAQTEPAVRRLLDEVAPGVDDENTMHFGEEKSRNDFADEDAGYVYGCMDPGDAMVLDVIAELGLDATPETATDDDGAEYRAKGREFVGSDAETAAAVLASVRENHVAQAAGRYARNADDPDDRATVYIHTDATPTGFVDVEAPGVQWLATDLQREILEELSTRASATTREVADAVGCSKEHVRETLQQLEDDDVVSRDAGSGPYGADVYHDDGAESARVDVGNRQQPPKDLSRWSLAIAAPHADGSPVTPASSGSSGDGEAATAGDDPPDDEWWRGDHRE